MEYNAKDGIELLKLINLPIKKDLESKFIEEYYASDAMLKHLKINHKNRHILNTGYAYTEVYSTGDELLDDNIFFDYLENVYSSSVYNSYNNIFIN